MKIIKILKTIINKTTHHLLPHQQITSPVVKIGLVDPKCLIYVMVKLQNVGHQEKVVIFVTKWLLNAQKFGLKFLKNIFI
eukprot:jgi/Orpsp1_1/1178233/evm.model.c7180000064508.1